MRFSHRAGPEAVQAGGRGAVAVQCRHAVGWRAGAAVEHRDVPTAGQPLGNRRRTDEPGTAEDKQSCAHAKTIPYVI